MKLIKLKSRALVGVLIMFSLLPNLNAQSNNYPVAAARASETDAVQTLYAKRWVEAFRRLNARNQITITIGSSENIVKVPNVVEMEAFSRFLIVRTKHENGSFYRSIIYPGQIILISESPPIEEENK